MQQIEMLNSYIAARARDLVPGGKRRYYQQPNICIKKLMDDLYPLYRLGLIEVIPILENGNAANGSFLNYQQITENVRSLRVADKVGIFDDLVK